MYHVILVDGNRSVELMARDIHFEIVPPESNVVYYGEETYVIPGPTPRQKVHVIFDDAMESEAQLNNFYRSPDEHAMDIWSDQVVGVLWRMGNVRMDSLVWGIGYDEEIGTRNGLEASFSYIASTHMRPMTQPHMEPIQNLDWKKLGF